VVPTCCRPDRSGPQQFARDGSGLVAEPGCPGVVELVEHVSQRLRLPPRLRAKIAAFTVSMIPCSVSGWSTLGDAALSSAASPAGQRVYAATSELQPFQQRRPRGRRLAGESYSSQCCGDGESAHRKPGRPRTWSSRFLRGLHSIPCPLATQPAAPRSRLFCIPLAIYHC
jgi:hypothetical protein